jgi:rhodanese-related sulfurtransferase
VKKAAIWVVVALAVVAVGYLALKPAGGGVKTVDSAGLVAAQAKGAQLIDVRTKSEYDLGHIPGAVNVPVDTLQSEAANWDRNAAYIVYCATGARSAQAVETMTAMGFKNIEHFAQGIQAWQGQLDKTEAPAAQGGSTTPAAPAASAPAAASGKIQTAGKPVVVEFYTDS